MRFKDKRSKIISMKIRRTGHGQEGLASIVVVSVLIIIMTLISIGFARLVNRTAIDSANKQFSASTTYAVQSAINDVASYLKQYAAANPGSNFLPKSTKCNGAGSLIGSTASPGPFYNDSNLSNDTSRSTQYTCLLLDPTPSNLVYTQVQNLKSQVVKVNTSASSGALDKLMLSWQPSNSQITGYPTSASNLNDETTWNSTTVNCKDSAGTNASCIPMLRVAIFPVSSGEALTGVQAQSKTVFLYPQSPSGNVPVKPFSGLSDGSLVPIPCTQSVGSTDFNPTTSTGYKCNIILSSLSTAISPASTDSVYMRITPIYNQADIRIAANDKFGNTLNFINDQAVIDATAQTAGIVKRLQARVDTSSLANGSGGTDTNISSSSNDIPEQAVRSAIALCKREIQTTPSAVGYDKFVNFDDPDAVCHDLGSTTTITNPVPTLTLGITGNNGPDSGRSVDSEANNPDSPQNPVQAGTVYVGTSPGSAGNATLNWTTTDATSCTASGGSAGWAGEKSGIMTFTGSPATNGAGNQAFSVSTVTSYFLQCSRPFAPSPTPNKKVTIWPYPRITGISSSPNPVHAGNNYTVSWSSVNAKPNGCVLSGGNWSSPSNTGNSGSETMNWPWNDNSSTRTFTVTCYDPIGRSDSSTISVNTSGGSCSGNGCGGGGGGQVVPPTCHANADIHDNGDGTAYPTWSGTCPDVSPGSGYYSLSSSTDGSWNIGGYRNVSSVGVADSGNGTWLQVGPGYHCVQLEAGADPWGWLVDSSTVCKTIKPTITVSVSYNWTGFDSASCDGDSNHYYCISAFVSGQSSYLYDSVSCTVTAPTGEPTISDGFLVMRWYSFGWQNYGDWFGESLSASCSDGYGASGSASTGIN